MLSRFHTIPACHRQTDRRTDKQLLYQYRPSVCWRAIKNNRCRWMRCEFTEDAVNLQLVPTYLRASLAPVTLDTPAMVSPAQVISPTSSGAGTNLKVAGAYPAWSVVNFFTGPLPLFKIPPEWRGTVHSSGVHAFIVLCLKLKPLQYSDSSTLWQYEGRSKISATRP